MTIKDIAQLAGVSKSTVSRVLNNASNVEEATREIVLKVMEENNYIPSATARSLSRQETTFIGVILPDLDNSFFGQIVQGINHTLAETEYTMLFCCTDNNAARELKALNLLNQQKICGLLISSSVNYCDTTTGGLIKKALTDINAPIVLIDRSIPNTPWDGVYSDNINGGYIAASSLITKGYQHIGAFVSDTKLLIGQERLLGFTRAMQEHHLAITDDYIYTQESPASLLEIYEYTCRLIDSGKLPEAIFLSNSIIANGFYKALFYKGVKPGEDIECVGFDYSEALDIMHIPYNYLERNSRLFGQTAAQMLLDSFQYKNKGKHVRREHIIPATLHE
ncbi:LacI family DNA-binding transcriptional regulator [Luxibacter massiliensis]|uniref:LacI family DNA-binding transcriptional regulator n=1 Tax=Luxibacter massiliensis TaxID=2219695 RepID=UPI000F04D503|nr:LacI family DNA-binding transcriptional regulator [Luxibacter massiliensis]